MNGSLADLLIPVLSSAVMQLPIFIAIAVSVIWVLGSPRSQIRTVALWGLALLGLVSLLSMVANIVPQLLVIQGKYNSLQGMSLIMGFLNFGLSLMLALAVVLLVWAMTRSLRDRTPPPAPPSRT